MFKIGFEPETGILRSENKGFWTADEARRYMEEIARQASQARRTAGALKLLVDGREADVVPADTAAVLADFERRIIAAPTDRVAVVVGSSLAKMQTRRNFASPQSEIFVSPSAAETWLLAYG